MMAMRNPSISKVIATFWLKFTCLMSSLIKEIQKIYGRVFRQEQCRLMMKRIQSWGAIRSKGMVYVSASESRRW